MSTPKYFNAAQWGTLLTREQVLFLADLTSKLQGIEEGATADPTDVEVETLYNDAVPAASQVEAEAGTEVEIRRWSPLRVKQAAAFPVGSVFISVVSTNPATLLGYGTWTALASGRVLIGLDSGDTDFDTVLETGGAKVHSHT